MCWHVNGGTSFISVQFLNFDEAKDIRSIVPLANGEPIYPFHSPDLKLHLSVKELGSENLLVAAENCWPMRGDLLA